MVNIAVFGCCVHAQRELISPAMEKHDHLIYPMLHWKQITAGRFTWPSQIKKKKQHYENKEAKTEF